MTAIILSVLLIAPIAFAAVSIDDVDPSSDVYDETIVVTGSGVTAGVDVNLYWDAVKVWDPVKGEGMLNSTEAESDGSFEVWFDVPEALDGNHYLWVKDTDTGDTASWGPFVMIPSLEMDPDSGLPDDKITIEGYGFSDEEDVIDIWLEDDTMTWVMDLDTTPGTPETEEDIGSWTATFKVPNLAYGDYYIAAEDDEGVIGRGEFTIGASIEIDIDEGPTGTVVKIEGVGFDPANTVDQGEVYMTDGTTNIACWILGDDPEEVDADGDIKLEVVIPSVPDWDDFDTLVVAPGTRTADEDFDVVGDAEIEAEPEYGVQGATISITGYNFTQLAEEEVIVYVGTEEADDFETESDGTFSGTFTVPAVSSGVYTLSAVMADHNIEAEMDFRVGLMIVILSPDDGPTGKSVTLTGSGFSGGESWNATFGNEEYMETIFENEIVEVDDTLSGEFYVPNFPVGDYIVTVMDEDTEIEVTAEFEITEQTLVELDPANAPNEYNVTIEGWYFTEDEGADIDFLLYNMTADGEVDDEWDMDVYQFGEDTPRRSAELNEDGNFTAWWEVPDDEDLSIGEYWINVTTAANGYDIVAVIPFNVISEVIDVDNRKDVYAIGDKVSFIIESSFKQIGAYFEIEDSNGDLYWKSDDLTDDDWVKVGELRLVPFAQQTAGGNPMELLDDAPLGTYSWVFYDEDDDELDSGSFTVEEAPEAALEGRIEDLDTAIGDLSDSVSGLSSDVSGVQSDVAAAKAAAEAAAQAADKIDDVAETANTAKEAADAAKASADAAKDAADEAKTAAGGLTNLVYAAIGASVIAALVGIFSLLQISRRIAG
jgi:outer membrane murein-binding lipoprotein Lpp